MSYKLEKMLTQLGEYIRVRALAYFYYHKELLEDKHYNCAYKLICDGQIRKYARFPIEEAIKRAEGDVIKVIHNCDREEIENIKKDVDYIADISRRYDIADRIDELNLLEY